MEWSSWFFTGVAGTKLGKNKVQRSNNMYNGISSCFDQGNDTVPQKDIHRQMPKTSIPHVGNLRGDTFVLLYMVVLYLNKNSGNATLTAPPSASQTYAQS